MQNISDNGIKYLFWALITSVIGYFLHSVEAILTPFIASVIIAYFLDPLTIKLEKLGIRRGWTVAIIVGLFFALIILGLIKLFPILFEQIQQFIRAIPRYEQYVSTVLLAKLDNYLLEINPQLATEVKGQLSNFSTKFFEYILIVIRGVFHSSIAMLNIVGLIFFTPILVYYLLRDFPSVKMHLDKLLPRKHKASILEECKQINNVLAAYIRGQLTVCLLLSVFYVIALEIIGLNYALLIGIIAGLLAIIPYLGLILGGAICVIVASLQYDELYHVYLTMAIFLVGHMVEAYVVAPKIVGDKVGLHPVWIIFSLMAGGELFGFWGIFFAIPISAVLGVIFKSLIKVYMSSHLYK